MEPSHTPGPWTVGKHATPDYAPQYGVYAGEASRDLATVKGGNAEADATLIAAAPDLLAALEMIESAMRDSPDFKDVATTQDGASIIPIAVARAAIAKAKGQ